MTVLAHDWSRHSLAIVFSQLTWPLPSGARCSLLYFALLACDYAHATTILNWGVCVCVHAGMPSVTLTHMLWTPVGLLLCEG